MFDLVANVDQILPRKYLTLVSPIANYIDGFAYEAKFRRWATTCSRARNQ